MMSGSVVFHAFEHGSNSLKTFEITEYYLKNYTFMALEKKL